MKLIATMPVRNEGWCLGLTLRAALLWCDEVVVGLHNCTDESGEIVCGIESALVDRVHLVENNSDSWDEMQHRQRLLEVARRREATHIAIVDADEILTANLIPVLQKAKELTTFCNAGSILHLPGFNLRNGIGEYHGNGIWGDRWFSTVFDDDAALGWFGDTFHHREPHGSTLLSFKPILPHQGGIMHLWGANERRLTAKHALYKMVERLRWPAKLVQEIDHTYNLWRSPADAKMLYGGLTPFSQPWVFNPVPSSWWSGYAEAGLMKYLDVNREPWQIAECQRLMAKHGPEAFTGLDLFGLV